MGLASPNEPLELADGTMIDPSTGKVIKNDSSEMIEVPSNSEAQAIVIATRRRLSDLPAVPQKMNAISIVLTYSLFGLSDQDISIATNLSEEQVGRLKMLDAYADMRSKVVESIAASDAENIRSMFRENAKRAANRMSEFIRSNDETIALAASKDALDRDGHRPADIVEHRHKVEGGLHIEYVKTDNTADAVTIDVSTTEVNES